MNRDINVAFVLALVALPAAMITDIIVIRALVAAPLVFYLTGHLVLRAIGASFPPLHWIVYSIGTSIAVCVLGGFLLNLVGGLVPLGWVCWLILVTVSVGYMARRRPVDWSDWSFSFPRLERWHVVSLSLTAVILASAYSVALYDATTEKQFSYTQFWMLPKPAPGRVTVGIKSGEREAQVFNLVVSADGVLIAQLSGIEMSPGDIWTHEISVGMQYNKAEARLYRVSDNVLYRRVNAFIPKTNKEAKG